MALKLSRKVHFLVFCPDIGQIKAIYIYTSGRSCYALSENGIVYQDSEILVFEVKEFC